MIKRAEADPSEELCEVNLTATKARLLLTAAIMKLGALPHATDPERPTSQELDAIRRLIDAYQQIFQTH